MQWGCPNDKSFAGFQDDDAIERSPGSEDRTNSHETDLSVSLHKMQVSPKAGFFLVCF